MLGPSPSLCTSMTAKPTAAMCIDRAEKTKTGITYMCLFIIFKLNLLG